MGNSINDFLFRECRHCECCRPEMVSMTCTASTNPHKWTKEEIEQMIIELTKRLLNAKWYMRGDLKRGLKHWIVKLERFNEAKEEFKI